MRKASAQNVKISSDSRQNLVKFDKKLQGFWCIITLNADLPDNYLTNSEKYHIMYMPSKQSKGKDYMIDINVKLNTVNDVRDFCNILSGYNFDARMTSGNYTVNAKSIIGIFSLNLQQETILTVNTNNLLDLPERIYKYLA